MTQEDLDWIKDLRKRIWLEKTSTSGCRQNTWFEDLPVLKKDRKPLLDWLEKHRDEVVFAPGSGSFGFGVSLSVYLLIPGPYPNVPDELEKLITITGKQMFPKDGSSKRDDSYEFVQGFTHTSKNKQAYKAAGFREPLHELSYYDY